MMTTRFKFHRMIPWLLLLGTILLVKESVYIVPQSSVAVIQPLIGSHVATDTIIESSPGLHYKKPVVQKAFIFDLRDQIFNASLALAATTAQPAIRIYYTATWKIEHPRRYAILTPPNTAAMEKQLIEAINLQLNKALLGSRFPALNGPEATTLQAHLLNTLNPSFSKLGIRLVGLNFVSTQFIDVDPANLFHSIRTQQAQLALKERELGDQKAAAIRQVAAQHAAQRLEQSRQQAALIRHQGDEQAAKIYYDAYHRDPTFAAFFLKLKAYQTAAKCSAKKENILILHLEDALSKKALETATIK